MKSQEKQRPSGRIQSALVWGILISTATVQTSFITQYLGRLFLFSFLLGTTIYAILFHRYLQIPFQVSLGITSVVFIQMGHLVLSPTLGEILRIGAFPAMLFVVIIVLPQLVTPVKFFSVVSQFAAGLVVLGLPTLLLSHFGPITPFIPPNSGGNINTTIIWSGGPTFNTVTSAFRNPNTLGIVAATGLMASLVKLFSTLRRKYIIFGLLCGIGILVSNSTAALVGSIVFISVYISLSMLPVVFGYLIILSGIVIPIILFILLFSELSLFPASVSLSGRTRLWSATIEAILTSPLFGHGARPASQIIEPYLDSGSAQAPHTSMVVFLSSGVIGGIAYFSAIYYSLKTSFSFRNEKINVGLVSVTFGLLAIDFFHGFSLFGFSMGTLLLGAIVGYASIPEQLRLNEDMEGLSSGENI